MYFSRMIQLNYSNYKEHNKLAVTTLSIMLISWVLEHIIELIGNVDCKMVYFCRITPIILSTCMHTRDNWRDTSTCALLSFFFPLVKGGSFT